MESWVEPVVSWRTDIDVLAQHRLLLTQGERLAEWPPAPTEHFPTDCFRIGRDFWIWQPGTGGLQFRDDQPTCVAYADPAADSAWFTHVVTRSWLPAVYQVWGRQVLHASAVARRDSGRVIAFAGPSGAGKSTLAYALARRQGWQPLADDTLAFSAAGGRLALHPLPNSTRLRPSTATHFDVPAGLAADTIPWPAVPMHLGGIYFLEGLDAADVAATLTPLKAGESYPLLLSQAHAFTLKLPEHNQRLMRDYLQLAASVPIVRLDYRRGFRDLDGVIDIVERHDRASQERGPA